MSLAGYLSQGKPGNDELWLPENQADTIGAEYSGDIHSGKISAGQRMADAGQPSNSPSVSDVPAGRPICTVIPKAPSVAARFAARTPPWTSRFARILAFSGPSREKRPSVKPERGKPGGASRTSEKTERAESPEWPPVGPFRQGHSVNQTHARDSSYRIWLLR